MLPVIWKEMKKKKLLVENETEMLLKLPLFGFKLTKH